MKQMFYSVTLFFALCGIAFGQAEPTASRRPSSQITLQGSGLFARSVKDDDLTYKPTSSVGGLAGYRFYVLRWLAVEGDVDYFRNAQKYTISSDSFRQKTDVGAATGAVVINMPNPLTKKFQSFALIGGGAMFFHPIESSLDIQTKNVIVFGGGIDIPMSRHFAVRAEARTMLYKVPDFGMADLKIDKFSQAMIPSAGLVYKF